MDWAIIKLGSYTKYSELYNHLIDTQEGGGGHPKIAQATEEHADENLLIFGEVTDQNLEQLIANIGKQEDATGKLIIIDEIKIENKQDILVRLANATGRMVVSKPNNSELITKTENGKLVCTLYASNRGSMAMETPTFFLTESGKNETIETGEKSIDIYNKIGIPREQRHQEDWGYFVDPGDPDYNLHGSTFTSEIITPSVQPIDPHTAEIGIGKTAIPEGYESKIPRMSTKFHF